MSRIIKLIISVGLLSSLYVSYSGTALATSDDGDLGMRAYAAYKAAVAANLRDKELNREYARLLIARSSRYGESNLQQMIRHLDGFLNPVCTVVYSFGGTSEKQELNVKRTRYVGPDSTYLQKAIIEAPNSEDQLTVQLKEWISGGWPTRTLTYRIESKIYDIDLDVRQEISKEQSEYFNSINVKVNGVRYLLKCEK